MADRVAELTDFDVLEIKLLALDYDISEDELDLFHLWPFPELWHHWTDDERRAFMVSNIPVIESGRAFLREFYRSRSEPDTFSPNLRDELRRGEENVAYNKRVESEVNDKLDTVALYHEAKRSQSREEVKRMDWPDEL